MQITFLFRSICLVWILFFPSLSVALPRTKLANQTNICPKRNSPILTFQKLWVDEKVHDVEIRMDKISDSLSGLYIRKNRAYFLFGSTLSDSNFFACLYPIGKAKAVDVIYGQIINKSIEFFSNFSKEHTILRMVPDNLSDSSLDQTLTVGTSNYVNSPTGETICNIEKVGFQFKKTISEESQRSVMSKVTKIISELVGNDIISDCAVQTTNQLRTRAVFNEVTFSSPDLLSLKIDFVKRDGEQIALSGRNSVIRIADGSEIDIPALLSPQESKSLIKAINEKLRIMYGEFAHVDSLDVFSFAFNQHSLIATYAPKNLFEDKIDIPIRFESFSLSLVEIVKRLKANIKESK